jgi:hypothetical protein
VLVVSGVSPALVATCATGRRAGFDRCAKHTEIGRGLAGDDAARSVTRVSAIEVQANATDELRHVLLAETSVGTTSARKGTLVAFVDAAQERVSVDARRLWMRVDHLLNCHVAPVVECCGCHPAAWVKRSVETSPPSRQTL